MTMTTKFTLRAIQAAALAALAASGATAGDAYLKLGDIKGETATSEKDHKKWIDIHSFSWGTTQAVGGVRIATGDVDGDGRADAAATTDVQAPRDSSSGMATGKRQHKPLTISKEMDKASPKLAQPSAKGSMSFRGQVTGCAAGTTYPSATLKTAAYRYEMKNVVITSCGGGSSSSASKPMESLSLNYSEIEIHRSDAKTQDGKVKVRGWDAEKKEE